MGGVLGGGYQPPSIRFEYLVVAVSSSDDCLQGGCAMTRKDYKTLARALGVALATAGGRAGETNGVGLAIDQVVVVLAADNPRFDQVRFEAAVVAEREAEDQRWEDHWAMLRELGYRRGDV